MLIHLDDFHQMERNTLRGFARVTLPELGLIVHDVAIHVREAKAWASPPGRPMLGRDGTQLPDAAGKAQFAPTISFANRGDQDTFSQAVLDAVWAAPLEALA